MNICTLRNTLNSCAYDLNIAYEFHVDVKKFLASYKQKRNFQFENFASEWRKYNFMGIFKGVSNIAVTAVFIQHSFTIIKKYLCSNCVFEKTGAFYLLFSIYYKQPIKDRVKIRCNQEELKQINGLLDFFQKYSFQTPLHFYLQMQNDGAFIFTPVQEECGLHWFYVRRFSVMLESLEIGQKGNSTSRDASDQDTKKIMQEYKELLHDDEDFSTLIEMEKEYLTLVNKLMETTESFSSFPPTVLEISYELCKGEEFHNNISKNENDTSKDDNTSDKDEGIKQVKMKAMANTGAIYRADRHVISAVNLNQPSTSSKSKK